MRAVFRPGARLQESWRGAGARWISLGEAVLASLIVLGDNVWHVLPNSVVLLSAMLVLGLLWSSALFGCAHGLSDSLALFLTFH